MLAGVAVATQESRDVGLSALILIGAIVAGLTIWRLVPARHYPRIAGLLVANAVVGGFVLADIGPDGTMAFKFFLLSLLALLIGLSLDENSN